MNAYPSSPIRPYYSIDSFDQPTIIKAIDPQKEVWEIHAQRYDEEAGGWMAQNVTVVLQSEDYGDYDVYCDDLLWEVTVSHLPNGWVAGMATEARPISSHVLRMRWRQENNLSIPPSWWGGSRRIKNEEAEDYLDRDRFEYAF